MLCKCTTCKQDFDYTADDISESATLTCPICSTTFEISAIIQQKVQKSEPEIPGGPEGIPGAPPSEFNKEPVPTAPEAIGDAINKLLKESDDPDRIVALFEQSKWEGDLPGFLAKVQGLIRDVGFAGDSADLITALYNEKSISMTSDGVQLDIEKLKKVLGKSNSINVAPDVGAPVEPVEDPVPEKPVEEPPLELPDDLDDLDLDKELGSKDIGFKEPEKPEEKPEEKLKKDTTQIDKAVLTYFS